MYTLQKQHAKLCLLLSILFYKIVKVKNSKINVIWYLNLTITWNDFKKEDGRKIFKVVVFKVVVVSGGYTKCCFWSYGTVYFENQVFLKYLVWLTSLKLIVCQNKAINNLQKLLLPSYLSRTGILFPFVY